MNQFDVLNHTLSALVDSQKPKRSESEIDALVTRGDPPFDKTITVEVTVEVQVPIWLTVDENGPDPVLSDPSDWKLAPMSDRTRAYVENEVERQVEADWRDAELAAEEEAAMARRWEP